MQTTRSSERAAERGSLADPGPADLPYRRILESTLGVPFTEGNRVDLLRNGVQIFPAMLEAIRGARRTVDLETYVYWTGNIARETADALVEAAARGVRVRLLLDAVGSLPMDDDLVRRLERAGVAVVRFRPPVRWKVWQVDNRTHRKVLVCDGEVAFTGGVGIAREWEGDARDPSEWRETHVRVRGPAVDGLRASFLQNWAEMGGRLWDEDEELGRPAAEGSVAVQVLRASASVSRSDVANVHRLLIGMARHRLRITTAYFAPDSEMVDELLTAAARGVAVEVLVPGEYHDERLSQLAGEATYRELLDGGVDVFHYLPTMLHAKVLTVDGRISTVGSANFNYRSRGKDDEVLLLFDDAAVTAALDRDFQGDLQRSERIDPERWKRRNLLQRGGEWAARRIRGEL